MSNSEPGLFSSDAAIDWLLELEDTGLLLLEETLREVVGAEGLQDGDVHRGTVALATLAHWLRRPVPGTELTGDLERWLRLMGERPPESLLDLACRAADRLEAHCDERSGSGASADPSLDGRSTMIREIRVRLSSA